MGINYDDLHGLQLVLDYPFNVTVKYHEFSYFLWINVNPTDIIWMSNAKSLNDFSQDRLKLNLILSLPIIWKLQNLIDL